MNIWLQSCGHWTLHHSSYIALPLIRCNRSHYCTVSSFLCNTDVLCFDAALCLMCFDFLCVCGVWLSVHVELGLPCTCTLLTKNSSSSSSFFGSFIRMMNLLMISISLNANNNCDNTSIKLIAFNTVHTYSAKIVDIPSREEGHYYDLW